MKVGGGRLTTSPAWLAAHARASSAARCARPTRAMAPTRATGAAGDKDGVPARAGGGRGRDARRGGGGGSNSGGRGGGGNGSGTGWGRSGTLDPQARTLVLGGARHPPTATSPARSPPRRGPLTVDGLAATARAGQGDVDDGSCCWCGSPVADASVGSGCRRNSSDKRRSRARRAMAAAGGSRTMWRLGGCGVLRGSGRAEGGGVQGHQVRSAEGGDQERRVGGGDRRASGVGQVHAVRWHLEVAHGGPSAHPPPRRARRRGRGRRRPPCVGGRRGHTTCEVPGGGAAPPSLSVCGREARRSWRATPAVVSHESTRTRVVARHAGGGSGGGGGAPPTRLRAGAADHQSAQCEQACARV